MALPMFPLGTVLFPSVVLPIHVFEPRYRVMTRHCLDGDREFGVVLIERGHEVGGGDVRTNIGTVARIIEASELPDGRWALGTVGTRRIRVLEWLPDDPYPRADVADFPDPDVEAGLALTEAYEAAQRLLRRVLALRAELGEPTPSATIELADDPVLGSFQAAALAPVSTLDRHRLLATEGVQARLDRVIDLLAEEATFLEARLGGGGIG